jgi:hypothetical protein
MGSHFALGMDWIVSKRVLFSVRTGKQFMKIEESHENKASSTGASRFYANPSINDDFLYVNWGGFYASAGISFSLYTSINKTKRR